MDILKRNILTSYLLSIPTVLFIYFTILAILAVLSGQAWVLIIIVVEYVWEFSGSFIFFLIAIWIGSKQVHRNLIDGKGLLKTSFNFSLLINSIILGTFILIAKFSNNGIDGLLLFVIFLISLISITLTIGLLISYLFRQNINKDEIND